ISDLVCFEAIIVELKTLNQISDRERSQLLNYLTDPCKLNASLLFGGGTACCARGRSVLRPYRVTRDVSFTLQITGKRAGCGWAFSSTSGVSASSNGSAWSNERPFVTLRALRG
ncbi:hypothetical protein JXA47_11365, partial [Candidatus Sumerlaeota bacterium]|nr:hypothetical protein [Candidatus Sumerlaeota bacterium]